VESGQRVIGASHHQSIKMSERVLELREIERYRELDRIVISYERYCEELKISGVSRKMSEEEREQQKRFWLNYCHAKEEMRKMEMTEAQRQEEKRAVAEKKKKLESQKIKSRIVNWAAKWKKSKEEELKVVEQRGAAASNQLCCGAGAGGVCGAVTGDVLMDAQYEWDVYDYGAAAAAEMLKKRLELERQRLKEEEDKKRSEVNAWDRWNNDLLVHGDDGANESYGDLNVKCNGGGAMVRVRGQKRKGGEQRDGKKMLEVESKKRKKAKESAVARRPVWCYVSVVAAVGVAAAVVAGALQWL